MTSVLVHHIPEDHAYGYRLGRHHEWDSRNLRYPAPATTSTFSPVYWPSVAPVLDQGDVGGCTGFALAGLLGKKIYHDTLPHLVVDNALGLSLYHDNTLNDSIPGTYPPTDTGSTSLAAGKTAKARGYVSGYSHIWAASSLATAIAKGPVEVGTVWYNSMFEPNSAGLLKVDASSGVAGGHEYVLDEVTADGRLGFLNSWGTSFGVQGRFYMQLADFLALLADEGDAVTFTPITAPAPTPVPVPSVDPNLLAAYKSLKAWATSAGVA